MLRKTKQKKTYHAKNPTTRVIDTDPALFRKTKDRTVGCRAETGSHGHQDICHHGGSQESKRCDPEQAKVEILP